MYDKYVIRSLVRDSEAYMQPKQNPRDQYHPFGPLSTALMFNSYHEAYCQAGSNSEVLVYGEAKWEEEKNKKNEKGLILTQTEIGCLAWVLTILVCLIVIYFAPTIRQVIWK